MKLRLELVLLVQLLLLNLFASFRLFFSLTNSRLFLTPLCPFPCSKPMQICGAFFAVRDRCHKAKRPERLLCLCLCLSLSRSLFAIQVFRSKHLVLCGFSGYEHLVFVVVVAIVAVVVVAIVVGVAISSIYC